MRVLFASRRALAICVLLGLGLALVVASYYLANWRFDAARLARRNDVNTQAENLLAACWRLPGFRSAIALESELLAVQQGDLRNEQALQSQALSRSEEGNLILEALAKGNLASFRWHEAQLHADAILRRQPDDARALWIRARARMEMQLEDLAREDLKQAVVSEPAAQEIRRSWADALHKSGYVHQAIEQYERLLAAHPNDERASLALAHCLQDQARLSDAITLVDALLARHPRSVACLIERGRLALRAGEAAGAETWLRSAIELSPDHLQANFVLGLALQAQNKIDREFESHRIHIETRQADLRSQLQQSPNSAEALTAIGRWAMRTGEENDAAGWFYSALKVDADYAPAHQGLAEFFSSVGQNNRAKLHTEKGGNAPSHGTQPQIALTTKADTAAAPQLSLSMQPNTSAVKEASSADVQRVCAACHAYPQPETLPRSVWRKEVKQGFDFLRDSILAEKYPSLESVVEYYERRAPKELQAIEQPIATQETPVRFEKRGTGWLPNVPLQPGVANANLASLFGGPNQELLLCETRLNALLIMKPYDSGPGGTVLAQLNTPCHSTVCDLNLDGRQDIIVASLGSFFPTDDRVGKVLWLRAGANGQFESKPLIEGIGRVADAQVADFTGDGRLDLVVAAFGWRTTGEILILENQTEDWASPKFVSQVVDSRHGAIHLQVTDLNGDKRPDFMGLIGQEHEAVVAYLNQADGTFHQETVFAAPNPTYGSTGMEMVDLDNDHDWDVLLTNGDILDRPYLLKPYHGVQWLENEGTFPYKHHEVAAMYGVARAVAADFDNDGDQDVVAVSCLPALLFPQRDKLQLPSVILLEQTAKSQFVTHVLETASCDHFSCAAGDWDNDGQVDLVVTNFAWNGSRPMADAAVMWRNLGPTASQAK